MEDKKHKLATPILLNILKESKVEYADGKVHLTYDSDKIDMFVSVDEDNLLLCELWIGIAEINLTEKQQNLVFDFTHVFLTDEIEKEKEFEKYFDRDDFRPSPN